jgi:hypothetical protein
VGIEFLGIPAFDTYTFDLSRYFWKPGGMFNPKDVMRFDF